MIHLPSEVQIMACPSERIGFYRSSMPNPTSNDVMAITKWSIASARRCHFTTPAISADITGATAEPDVGIGMFRSPTRSI